MTEKPRRQSGSNKWKFGVIGVGLAVILVPLMLFLFLPDQTYGTVLFYDGKTETRTTYTVSQSFVIRGSCGIVHETRVWISGAYVAPTDRYFWACHDKSWD